MPYLARSSALDESPPQSYLEHVFHVLIRSRGYLRKVLIFSRNEKCRWTSVKVDACK